MSGERAGHSRRSILLFVNQCKVCIYYFKIYLTGFKSKIFRHLNNNSDNHLLQLVPRRAKSDPLLVTPTCEKRFQSERVTIGMTSTSGADCVSIEQDRVDAVNTPLRVSSLWPHDIALWFLMLESQFEAARITSDKRKFHAAVTNITTQHMRLVRDILFDPPEIGQYEYLKKDLIRRLADSDSMRVRKRDLPLRRTRNGVSRWRTSTRLSSAWTS